MRYEGYMWGIVPHELKMPNLFKQVTFFPRRYAAAKTLVQNHQICKLVSP